MELLRSSGATYLRTRPVFALVAAVSVDVALGQQCTIHPETVAERSPLGVLLGAESGEPGRLLELAATVGIDWAPGRHLADGSGLKGAAVERRVANGLERRAEEISRLRDTAWRLLGERPRPTEAIPDISDELQGLIGEIRLAVDVEADSGLPCARYLSSDPIALAAVEALLVAAEGGSMRRCAICEDPFVPQARSDEIYCRRATPGEPPGGRTCQQVGPQRRYTVDPFTAVYRRTYNRLDQRARHGHISRAVLDDWRDKALKILDTGRRNKRAPDWLQGQLERIEPEGG